MRVKHENINIHIHGGREENLYKYKKNDRSYRDKMKWDNKIDRKNKELLHRTSRKLQMH